MVGTKRAFIERETGGGPQEKAFEGTENVLLSNFELHRSCCLSLGPARREREGCLALTTFSAGVAGQIQVYVLGHLSSNKWPFSWGSPMFSNRRALLLSWVHSHLAK